LEESDWAVRTKRNYLVTMGTVLDFALKRGDVGSNPTIGIARPILDDKAPGILSPSQARDLLKKAQIIAPQIVPALAISLFAGLRRSEVCALHWCEIDLPTKAIEVKGSKAKTRQRRIVTIADNLFLWLNAEREKSGPIFPSSSPDAFGELLRECGVAAEIKPWPHNAARHSFASHYYAKTQDELKTAAQMGKLTGHPLPSLPCPR
jgi:integrase/recombinase XerD